MFLSLHSVMTIQIFVTNSMEWTSSLLLKKNVFNWSNTLATLWYWEWSLVDCRRLTFLIVTHRPDTKLIQQTILGITSTSTGVHGTSLDRSKISSFPLSRRFGSPTHGLPLSPNLLSQLCHNESNSSYLSASRNVNRETNNALLLRPHHYWNHFRRDRLSSLERKYTRAH